MKAHLFEPDRTVIGRQIRNSFRNDGLGEESNVQKMHVAGFPEGNRRLGHFPVRCLSPQEDIRLNPNEQGLTPLSLLVADATDPSNDKGERTE